MATIVVIRVKDRTAAVLNKTTSVKEEVSSAIMLLEVVAEVCSKKTNGDNKKLKREGI